MYQRILLAYDGSKSGQQALLECRDVAQWSQAAVSLIAVTPLYIHMVGVEAGIYDNELAAQEKEKYTSILNDGIQQLMSAGFHASGEVLVGETVDEIVRHAKKVNADLIVLGHRHLEGWAARWWRGSVSKSLIENSPCSVLVVITR
jgi:nucleotide-binding universal stress UspA family protein